MAFQTEKPKTPYKYQRYPLVMHRGIESRVAQSVEDEANAVAAGWSTSRPAFTEPVPAPPEPSLLERVEALEEAVAKLARKPGRPKHTESE